jgi:hypothetical protein
MRHIGAILLVLALLGVFMLPGLARQAGRTPDANSAEMAAAPNTTGTPALLFPLVFNPPTPTPTSTPTATRTPTATPTATTGLPLPQPMQGNIRREDPNKPSYATYIEDIWHWFWIRNNNASRVYFGILGVNVQKHQSSYSFFHTSWDGAQAPNGVLEINGGGCYGPVGIPCGGSAGSSEQRDKVIVTEPGTYTLSLHICQSSFSTCTNPSGGGHWSGPLSSVQFVAIHWTPSAPTGDPKPLPEEPCRLITDNPGGTYLSCKDGLP